MMLQWLQSDY